MGTLSENALLYEPGQVNEKVGRMRRLRRKIAESWLRTAGSEIADSYRGQLGSLHRQCLSSDIKAFPLTGEEREFAETVLNRIRINGQVHDNLNQILAAMLYFHPYQMPVSMELGFLPEWFRQDYFEFMIQPPLLFLEVGEIDAYSTHIRWVVSYVRERIREDPNSRLWRRMAFILLEKSRFISLYFTKESLKNLFVQRAEIIEFWLKSNGYELDVRLPPPSLNRSRIRLGIYLNEIRPRTETFATLPLFDFLDRNMFEVFAYMHTSNENPIEVYVRKITDKCTVLPQDWKECIRTIRADDLDILLFGGNMSAVTSDSCVLGAHRVARFQCVHFCNPVTTGIRNVDYFILGSLVELNGDSDGQYSEKILRLKGSGICFNQGTDARTPAHPFTRSSLGIPEKGVLFVSGANFFKIIPELRLTWARILAEVPESMLAIYPFGPAWSTDYPVWPFIRDMKEILNRYGIAEERLLVLKPFKSREEIKGFLALTDIYLDAIPYSGATSLLDPLAMGVPTVVMDGPDLRLCQGAAMLREMGVPGLIADNEDKYVSLAMELATHRDLRNALSTDIIRKMRLGPAFLNPRAYGQEMDRALTRLVSQESTPGGRTLS